MTEDLAMSVLKDQAGTVDYTSLEELNPEAGSRIAVVLKSTRDDFWNTVRKGMEDAVDAINEKMGYTGEDQITVSFDGPADDTDVEKQIDLIDAVLSENPAILCIAAIDRQSCEAQLEMAAENDIPVIMLDSGVDNGPVSVLCATDNYAAGVEAAKRLAEAIEDQGQIAVMTHTESAQTSQDRMLLAKLWDKIQAGIQRSIPVGTCFLSPGNWKWPGISSGSPRGFSPSAATRKRNEKCWCICRTIWRRAGCWVGTAPASVSVPPSIRGTAPAIGTFWAL